MWPKQLPTLNCEHFLRCFQPHLPEIKRWAQGIKQRENSLYSYRIDSPESASFSVGVQSENQDRRIDARVHPLLFPPPDIFLLVEQCARASPACRAKTHRKAKN